MPENAKDSEFIETLEGELYDCVEKLRSFDWQNENDLIDAAKEITRMSDILDYVDTNPLDESTKKYLLQSNTPLADMAYIWKELREASVAEYGVKDALRDIVDKDLLAGDDGENLEQAISEQIEPDHAARSLQTANTLEDAKRLVSRGQERLTVTQTQKLLCGIGEILENEGGEQDQYYLFNHRLGGFAGFCGEATGVTDLNGEMLCVGDMIRPGSNMDNSSLVFLHSDGAPFPPTDYVKEAKVRRLAGWQDSILFLRSRDFEVFSCRNDYRMSRQLAPHRRADTRERRQGGR